MVAGGVIIEAGVVLHEVMIVQFLDTAIRKSLNRAAARPITRGALVVFRL